MPSKYEVASNETVPVARTIIAKALVEKYQLRETVVAEYLGVAQAAISKYLTGKYSESLKEKLREMEAKMQSKRELIDDYIHKIAEGKQEYVNVCICTMCAVANDIVCAFSHATGKSAAQA